LCSLTISSNEHAVFLEGAKGLLLSNWVCVGGVVGKSSEREREREREIEEERRIS